MAMRPEDLKLFRSRSLLLAVCDKARYHQGGVRARYVHRLVTDEDVAEAMLKGAGRKGTMKQLLAIDVGTLSARAGLFDARGRLSPTRHSNC